MVQIQTARSNTSRFYSHIFLGAAAGAATVALTAVGGGTTLGAATGIGIILGIGYIQLFGSLGGCGPPF